MPNYNIRCKKCKKNYEVECSMKDITYYLKNEKCSECGGEIYQDYTGKLIADIWHCPGNTRWQGKSTKRDGTQDKLDSELRKNDFYQQERHVPEKIKYDRNKAKDLAVKMGYRGY